jgi:hypothetical protein
MAHLWLRHDGNDWSAMPLTGHAMDISVHPPRILAESFRLGEDSRAALIRVATEDPPVWVLLVSAGSDVRINGFAPVADVRVLQDRDEIRVTPTGALFFSTEMLARVEEFPGSERAVFCGRCRQAMEKGQMAVRCPHSRCGIWYHQTGKLPCWTYAPSCGFCPQPTSLDAGFSWIPEA